MKISWALISCIWVFALFAEKHNTVSVNPKQNCTDSVLRPCCLKSDSANRFSIYGQPLVLQPNGSNLYYAVQAIPFDPDIALPISSPDWHVLEISPNYSLGFQVGARFFFAQSDMTLEINWERLHASKKESFTVPIATDMVGPIFDIGANSTAYEIAYGEGIFHFDSAKFMFGKKLCFTPSFYTHFYTSATFARIKQNILSQYSNLSGTVQRNISAPSTFTGAGPEFGFHFDYLLGSHFFFTGSSCISLIMGQLQNQITYESYTPELPAFHDPEPNVQTTTVPNRSQLVPGFEEKLGFSWKREFSKSTLTFEVGYQFQIYLNAVQSFDMISQALPSGVAFTSDVGLFAVGFQRTLSNFILSGPYFSFFIDF